VRLNKRSIAALAAVAAVMIPTASASAAQLAKFKNPADGCTYTVWGPDAAIQTLPKPGVQTSGGFGETVSCP
jgi:hypothetical protein